MPNTYNIPFAQVLQTSQFIDQIISSWTPQQIEQWALNNPASVELVVNDYGYCLITHPEFSQASPQDQQAAFDVFRSHFENLGTFVDPSTVTTILVDLSFMGIVEGIDAVTDNISDDQELFISPFDWATILQNVVDAPFFNPSVTQQEANDVLRGILENLSSNQFADIAQIVDAGQLGLIMENAGFNGNIDAIDAIVDNLSDDAELFIAPFTWSNILQLVVDAPFFDPSVTQAQANDLLRDIMEQLADNQFADIAQIVDAGQLGLIMENAGFNGNIDAIDAIVDNLSDDAELFIAPFTWSNILQLVVDAPFFDPTVTQAEANDLLRDIMEQLADNQFADIAQIVDAGQLGLIMENAGFNGNIDAIDAIVDNLSDDAELFIAPFTWSNILQLVVDAPFFDPSVTQAEANDLLRDIMEQLADNQFADIAQIVDAGQLGLIMENAGFNGNIDAIDAIVDNLSDDAELFIAPFTWSNILQLVVDAPFFDPSVTQAQANDLLRDIMEQLADNQFADIAQIVDAGQLGLIMENAGFNGNIDAIDAIVDNLSDDAELFIAPFTWSNILQLVVDAPFFDPTVTQAQANDLLRDIMEQLADNQFADIAQIVDAGQLGLIMENAGFNGNIDAIDAIVDNLSDDAELFIAPFTWSNILQLVVDAPFFDPSVTQAEANDLLRDIMEQLADNQFADIAQIVDAGQLGLIMENAGFNGNIDAIDAIVDNLSDDAELFIAPFTWSNILQLVVDAPFFDPSVTQAEANDLLRDIMEQLADNQFADIAQIVDAGQLDAVVQNSALNDNFEAVDAVLDNLSDQALASIDTVALQAAGVDIGTNGAETLWDSAGNFEALYGLGGNDFVIGGNGDTALYGGDGVDYVYDFGGSDNDVISGGDGSDFLYGAGGADSFVFYEGETGVDTIWVFNSAEGDRLNVNDYLDQYDATQHAIEDFVILTEANGNTTVSIDADGQGSGGTQDIAVLNGVTGLDVDDVIDTTGLV